jgi:hypothetical protein
MDKNLSVPKLSNYKMDKNLSIQKIFNFSIKKKDTNLSHREIFIDRFLSIAVPAEYWISDLVYQERAGIQTERNVPLNTSAIAVN